MAATDVGRAFEPRNRAHWLRDRARDDSTPEETPMDDALRYDARAMTQHGAMAQVIAQTGASAVSAKRKRIEADSFTGCLLGLFALIQRIASIASRITGPRFAADMLLE